MCRSLKISPQPTEPHPQPMRDRSILNPTPHATVYTFLYIPPSRHTECFRVPIHFHQRGTIISNFTLSPQCGPPELKMLVPVFRPREGRAHRTQCDHEISKCEFEGDCLLMWVLDPNRMTKSPILIEMVFSPLRLSHPTSIYFWQRPEKGLRRSIVDTGGYSYQTLLPPVRPKV